MKNQNKIVTREEHEKWSNICWGFQVASIVMLFITIFVLNSLSKQDAKSVVWWMVIPIFIVGTIGFITGEISIRKTNAYFKQKYQGIKDILKD